MKFLSQILFCLVILLFNSGRLSAQEKEHPRIYITNGGKTDFLHSIKQTEWKEEIIKARKKSLKNI